MKKRNTPNKQRHSNPHPDNETALSPWDVSLLKKVRNEVNVRQAGGSDSIMSVEEAIQQKYLQVALSGSPHALNQISKQIREAEAVEAALSAEAIDVGKRILIHQQQELERQLLKAKEDGLTDEEIEELDRNFYPHPSDAVLNDKGLCFSGPIDEISLKSVIFIRDVRDAFLLQDVLDQRYPVPEPANEYEQLDEEHILLFDKIVHQDFLNQRSSMLFSMSFDSFLPKRFQISRNDVYFKQLKWERLTKRELVKTCHQTWKGLGILLPRGSVSLPIEEGLRVQLMFHMRIKKLGELAMRDTPITDMEYMDLFEGVRREVNQLL